MSVCGLGSCHVIVVVCGVCGKHGGCQGFVHR